MCKSRLELLVQVVFFGASGRTPLGLFFRQVGFEFLMRFADIGLVLDQRRKRLLDELLI
jgi:hypothetical protein